MYGIRPTTVTNAISSGNYGWGEKLDGKPTIQFDGEYYPYSAVKNNISKFYRQGYTFTNTAAFSGGNDNGNFRLSLSNLSNGSIVRNSDLNRKTFNLSASQNVTKKLNINVVANFINETSNLKPNLSDGPFNVNNIQYLAANEDQAILAPGYAPDGSEIRWNSDTFTTNPYFTVNRFINDVNRNRLIAALSGKYNFNNWMYAQLRLGNDILYDKRKTVTPTGTAYYAGGMGGLDEQSNTRRSELNSDLLIGAKHDIIAKVLSFDISRRD